jgi:hypothetical protein
MSHDEAGHRLLIHENELSGSSDKPKLEASRLREGSKSGCQDFHEAEQRSFYNRFNQVGQQIASGDMKALMIREGITFVDR